MFSTRVWKQAPNPRDAGILRSSCLQEPAGRVARVRSLSSVLRRALPLGWLQHRSSQHASSSKSSALGLTLCVLRWEPAHPPLTEASIRDPRMSPVQHKVPEHLPSSGDSGLLKDLILDYFQYDHPSFTEMSKTNLGLQMTLRVFSSAAFRLA